MREEEEIGRIHNPTEEEPEPGLLFFYEETEWRMTTLAEHLAWINVLAERHGHPVRALNYVFTTDAQIVILNDAYLQHSDYTDILTFDCRTDPESERYLFADVYISVERIVDNAIVFGVPFEEELRRVMAHGLLHLVGYDDHEPEDIAEMRAAEQEALALFHRMFPGVD